MSLMSRDSCHLLGGRPPAWLCVLVAPVALVGLDQMSAEDLAGLEIAHEHLVVIGEREHTSTSVFGAGPEVMHPSGAAETHAPLLVEAVIPQPVMPLGPRTGRQRLRSRLVCASRGIAVERAVRAPLVVIRAEVIELALQLLQRVRSRSGSEPPLLRLMEPLDLPLRLRMPRRSVLLANTQDRERVFKRVAAPS
jgi:hypothetical protein